MGGRIISNPKSKSRKSSKRSAKRTFATFALKSAKVKNQWVDNIKQYYIIKKE